MRFEDHFSKQAQVYAQYRPHYPSKLFVYLASIAPGRQMAWDCGTGNGQAAIELIKHFDRVVATDASSDQIAQALPHARIDYRVEPAEEVSLAADTVDLVTVAVAVHWFDLERFYREVRRTLKASGVLAVWTYHLPVIEPRVDQILTTYYAEILSGYWPERFRYVDDRYRTLPFPFKELQPPRFEMEAEWDLSQLVGFLESWSATQRYEQAKGHHPITLIWQELIAAWGEPERRRLIRWPLHLRIGKVS